ncbi:hypothetical protein SDC9_65994 [bioreactor metagenome]|uniref:Uncharacterized protein n=1 Tax=bioreactor metagenome TaxID=1076179 RepID=A0A644XUX5_9ZZZZ
MNFNRDAGRKCGVSAVDHHAASSLADNVFDPGCRVNSINRDVSNVHRHQGYYSNRIKYFLVPVNDYRMICPDTGAFNSCFQLIDQHFKFAPGQLPVASPNSSFFSVCVFFFEDPGVKIIVHTRNFRSRDSGH